jgi:hypothetical protein
MGIYNQARVFGLSGTLVVKNQLSVHFRNGIRRLRLIEIEPFNGPGQFDTPATFFMEPIRIYRRLQERSYILVAAEICLKANQIRDHVF